MGLRLNAFLAGLSLLVSGCAIADAPVPPATSISPVYQYGYCWILDPHYPKCATAKWDNLSKITDPGQRLKVFHELCPVGSVACVHNNADGSCTVFSKVSEVQAHDYWDHGITMYEHERFHWRDGLVHPIKIKSYYNPITKSLEGYWEHDWSCRDGK